MSGQVVHALGEGELGKQGLADGAGVGGGFEVDPFVDLGCGRSERAGGDVDLAVGFGIGVVAAIMGVASLAVSC
ncbi:hypothetical protein ACFWBF_28510 [Streptomyces sp. NPDC060028]|uniref:hypothetical protein n=1 Tax=Streptomyces sp. NPDC060028 TaxID=3347041 RepID=UPI003677322D